MAIGLLNVLVDFGIDRVSPFKESVESEQIDTRCTFLLRFQIARD